MCNLLSQSFQSGSAAGLFINQLVWTLCLHFASAGRKNTVSVCSQSICILYKSQEWHIQLSFDGSVSYFHVFWRKNTQKNKNWHLAFCVGTQTVFLHLVTGPQEADCVFLHRRTCVATITFTLSTLVTVSVWATVLVKVPFYSDASDLFFFHICLFYSCYPHKVVLFCKTLITVSVWISFESLGSFCDLSSRGDSVCSWSFIAKQRGETGSLTFWAQAYTNEAKGFVFLLLSLRSLYTIFLMGVNWKSMQTLYIFIFKEHIVHKSSLRGVSVTGNRYVKWQVNINKRWEWGRLSTSADVCLTAWSDRNQINKPVCAASIIVEHDENKDGNAQNFSSKKNI